MKTPLEISFHNLMSSPAIEAEIQRRVAKLEKLYPRMISCRVAVEKPHRQRRNGNIFEIHIEMGLPGRSLAVTREPNRAARRYQKPTIRTALTEAFHTAEARLKSFKALRRGAVKPHAVMLPGTIQRIDKRNGSGFLTTNDGKEMYFHRNSLLSGEFEKLKRGDTVQYTEAMGDTGPTANKVWLSASDRAG